MTEFQRRQYNNVSGLFGKLIPFGIGLAAHNFGIGTAMWLLLAGPIALFIGLPKKRSKVTSGALSYIEGSKVTLTFDLRLLTFHFT